jgi:hypothetical protein
MECIHLPCSSPCRSTLLDTSQESAATLLGPNTTCEEEVKDVGLLDFLLQTPLRIV